LSSAALMNPIHGSFPQSEQLDSSSLSALLDILPSGLLVVSPTNDILLLNQRGKQLLKLEDDTMPTQLEGLPNHLAPFYNLIAEAEHDTPRGEVNVVFPQETTTEQEPEASTLGYNLKLLSQTPSQKLVVFNDITNILKDRRAMDTIREELSQSRKMASVGTMIAGVVHELNNPLTGISMSTELSRMGLERLKKGLASDLSPDEGCSHVDQALNEIRKISQSVKKAAVLVSDLLTYSRPTTLTMSPCALHEIVDESIHACKSHPDFNQIQFQFETDPPALEEKLRRAMVMCDRVKLEQVFYNLFKNAAEAMDGKGNIQITLSDRVVPGAVPGAGDKKLLQVAVRDFGCGISPQIAQKIFEPFFTTKKETGTGLGLSMSYRTIEQHGGELTVSTSTSTASGTTFLVLLPRVAETEEAFSGEGFSGEGASSA
jgi:two-component system, NtrC family, sensor kinase